MAESDALPSWRDGATKAAILDYVARVTEVRGPDHIEVPARVAVFDNDGTLWCERPAYVQALFILDELRVAGVEADLTGGPEALLAAVLHVHAGLTAEEFAARARSWLDTAVHPTLGVRFTELTYAPMLELIELLRKHEFRVFVVSGGGVEFVRAISLDVYGVAPDDVVGSAVELSLERRDGQVVLVRQPALVGSPNEGAPKAINIQGHIGVRPVFAAGNTAGDAEMLEYAHTGALPSFCLLVDHDDAEREFAYAGASVTDPDAEPILDTAARFGWTVASMRQDWARVF